MDMPKQPVFQDEFMHGCALYADDPRDVGNRALAHGGEPVGFSSRVEVAAMLVCFKGELPEK